MDTFYGEVISLYKMIIVDDEAEIRNGLANYFPWDQFGFHVVSVISNGKQALEFVQHNKIELVLTDIKMPIMDGIDLAKELHLHHPSIFIIFLSGYKDFHYAREGLKYGVKDYILKPGKYEEIKEVFSRVKQQIDKAWNKKDDVKKTYSENIVDTIERYIQKNYTHVTLEDISAVLNMSPNYVSSLYRKKTGKTISHYVTKVRMEKAAELLTDYHYKAYEVSETIGYRNPKNFTRMFKKYHGMTPREFRSERMGSKQNEQ